MRTYKFRGIPINKKDRDSFGYEVGKPIDPFVYGDLEIDYNYGGGTKYYISMEVFGTLAYRQRIEVRPETVGQFIGKKDIHNEEMFVGDKVKYNLKYSDGDGLIGTIVFDEKQMAYTVTNFYAGYQDYPTLAFSEKCEFEIIGNIHD